MAEKVLDAKKAEGSIGQLRRVKSFYQP